MQDFDNRPMNITISKVFGHEEMLIRVKIQDKGSNSFIEVDLGLEHFAECITGHGNIPCTGRSFRLAHFGKEMEVKKISLQIPCAVYDQNVKRIAKECANKYIEENISGEGWMVDDAFNSRDSFYQEEGKTCARCVIRRWICS